MTDRPVFWQRLHIIFPRLLGSTATDRSSGEQEPPISGGDSLVGVELDETTTHNDSSGLQDNDDSGTPSDSFIDLEDDARLDDIPSGWRKLAAVQSNFQNRSIFRTYPDLHHLILSYLQRKIADIEDQLRKRDEEEEGETDQPGSSSCRELRDPLLERAEELVRNYDQFLLSFKEIGDLPRVMSPQHKALYRRAEGVGLDKNEIAFMLKNDYVSLKRDLIHEMMLTRWMYKKKKKNIFLVKCLGKRFLNSRGQQIAFLWKDKIEMTGKVLIAIASGMMLLSPVLVLYLGDMTKPQAAGVSAMFVIMFTIVLCLTPGITFVATLVSLCAFVAVLVNFLSQSQMGGYNIM